MSSFGHDEPDLCACGQKAGHTQPCLFRQAKCDHVPMKAALDNSVHCIRCGADLGLKQ